MKPVSILITIGCILTLCGCADPLEQRSGEEVGSQLEQGLSGGGRLGPEQREANDPAGEHSVPQTHE